MNPVPCVIYYGSLLTCVSLGSFYRNLGSANMKRDFGTGLGMLLTVLICGQYVYHSLLMVWVNIIIIKCCNKSYMHKISLAYTWIYLLYLHFNVKNMYAMWMLQIQALKLVGLAFEINDNTVTMEHLTKVNVEGSSSVCAQPSSAEIASYLYCFIGLHKGPYYRWKVYADHFNDQLTVYADLWPITEMQLKKAFVCTVAYFVLRAAYSPELYKDPSFYKNYGADFRFLYNIPISVMYLLHYEAMILLCTSVCTETGVGVYSSKHSPSRLGLNNSDGSEEKIDFSTMQCFHNQKLVFGPTMKDTINSWNIPTRSWFMNHIYQGLLKSNKETRSVVSFMAWTIWRGPTIPNAICASTLWVYIQLESLYLKLYNTAGSMKVPWDIGFSIMRLFCLLYLTPSFVLNDTATVFQYYNSIFWVYHFILIVLLIFALVVNKLRNT